VALVPIGFMIGEGKGTYCSYTSLYQYKNTFLSDLRYCTVSPEILKTQQQLHMKVWVVEEICVEKGIEMTSKPA